MKNRIVNYIRAAFPGLYITSHEEVRVEVVVKEAAKAVDEVYVDKKAVCSDGRTPLRATLWAWTITQGVQCVWSPSKTELGVQIKGTEDPGKALDWLTGNSKEGSILVLKDFQWFTEGKNPVLLRKIKDTLAVAKGTNRSVVTIGCRLGLLPELEKEMTLIDFSLPSPEQLRTSLRNITEGTGRKPLDSEVENSLVQAAAGLTTIEAENAFALSIIEVGEVRKDIVYREKCLTVRKNGLLEIVDKKVSLDDIGGLENLKKWLQHRKDAFTEAAKAFRLPIPRGVLFVGQPGTGKTLTAMACRVIFDLPLLSLDASRLYGSLVGQTESNWRAVINLARAMAPCILMINEIDGAMSGGESSGKTDGGTTARLIKSMLQDIETSEGVFFVMTANEIDAIPSPLLRRMDEVWNVELPTKAEREAIWGIQLRAYGRDPSKFDLHALATESAEFSGFEIRKCVEQGLHIAFPERRDLTTADLVKVVDEFVPLAETMADDIRKRRERLKGVAKLAGVSAAPEKSKVSRRLGSFQG